MNRLPLSLIGSFLLPLGCGDPTGPVLQPSALCSAHGPTAIATFEDVNLEVAIRVALGVGGQGDLTCGQVAGLTSLQAAGRGIVSLVGIQNLTGLEDLGLSINEITDPSPLSGLTRLELLAIDLNLITDISALSGLINLKGLSIFENEITDLDGLSGLTSLVILYASHNLISDISRLNGLTSLQDLHLQRNTITDISALRGFPNLFTLRLDENTNLSDIQPLLDNTGLPPGEVDGRRGDTTVFLVLTKVSCEDVLALRAKGLLVVSNFPLGPCCYGPASGC